MDYKTYLDFVLALENKREPQALSYFFRILDVKQVCGHYLHSICLDALGYKTQAQSPQTFFPDAMRPWQLLDFVY